MRGNTGREEPPSDHKSQHMRSIATVDTFLTVYLLPMQVVAGEEGGGGGGGGLNVVVEGLHYPNSSCVNRLL